MSNPVKTSKLRHLGQAAVVAILAGASAGCSADVSRFGSFFESTDNQNSIVTGSLPANPTTPVTPGALPPPVNPVVTNGVKSAMAGWSANGGTPITTVPGDTIDVLAKRYGVPAEALASVNGLSPTGALAAGQKIIIPTYNMAAKAVTDTAKATVDSTVAAGSTYVVKAGDSLGALANAHGLRSTELAALNGIDPTKPIRIGQKIKLPAAGTKVAALATGTATDAMPTAVPKPETLPTATAALPEVPGPATPEAPKPSTEVAAVQPQTTPKPQLNAGTGVESDKSGNFRWPVRGRVISSYGVKANGERNDGINIEVPEGTPIKAAEGGTVIYAGNELKGFGNLVLIKHPSGFVSAYAHASELLVKRDDVIMRGQTIGKVGATGNVTRPQLHFEIRQGNKPIDPLPHLAG